MSSSLCSLQLRCSQSYYRGEDVVIARKAEVVGFLWVVSSVLSLSWGAIKGSVVVVSKVMVLEISSCV